MNGATAEWTAGMERSVGRLRWFVGVLVAGLVGGAGAVTVVIENGRSPKLAAGSGDPSTVLVGAALLLILAASRLETMVRRRAVGLGPGVPEVLVAGYAQGVAASCILIAVAGALGLGTALITERVLTAWAFAGAAILGILVRWPRRQAVLRRLRTA